ncbi:MAG: hypothetical protein DIU54_014140 [Acidobacteriota bacterium]
MMTGAPVGAWQSPGSSAAPGPTTTAATVGTGEQSDQPDTVSPETTADDGNEPQLSRIVSPHTLERIRRALEADESPDLQLDNTFYLLITRKAPTFADYLATAPPGWAEITPIAPPSAGPGRGPSPASTAVAGGGFDLLSLFQAIGRARQEREAGRIRDQIDRELEQFQRGTPEPAGEASARPQGEPDDSPPAAPK